MLKEILAQEFVTPDLERVSLLSVLMQLRLMSYWRDRVDQIFSQSLIPRLHKQEAKACKQIPGIMTDLSPANEMEIMGGQSTLKSYVGLVGTTVSNYSYSPLSGSGNIKL